MSVLRLPGGWGWGEGEMCVCVCARARAHVCVSELDFADWWVWGRNWEKEVVF